MDILVLSGSSRRGSLNIRLARLVVDARPGDAVTVVDDLTRLPFYDGDLEAAGAPQPVADLRAAVGAADVVVITTPEYNGAVPGLLANAVDWLSRPHGRSPLRGKPVLVLSASPSPRGGARAAERLREVLARIGAAVMPHGLAVASAHARLGSEEPDRELIAELRDQIDSLLEPATALSA